jgi:hypothetical protein
VLIYLARSKSAGFLERAVLGVWLLLMAACGSEDTEASSKTTSKPNTREPGSVFTAKTAGKACAADKDCGNGVCSKQFSGVLGDTQTAPGGYCTFACRVDADCGEGAACVGANAGGLGFGGVGTASSEGLCLAVCTSSAMCREGYRCFDALGQSAESASAGSSALGTAGSASIAATSGAATCGIAPATDKLAPGVAGEACSADMDCQGGRCMMSDLLMTSYPSGYCTGNCISDADCGDGAVCGEAFAGQAGTCYRTCAEDSDCARDGYRCRASVFPPGAAKRCLPGSEPLADGVVGEPCTQDSDCGGATCLQTMAAGMNTQRALPDGYCSGSCVEDLDCGAGGRCSGSFGGFAMGSCYLGCVEDTDCRNGYACMPTNAGFGNFGGAAMAGMQPTVCVASTVAIDQDAGVP